MLQLYGRFMKSVKKLLSVAIAYAMLGLTQKANALPVPIFLAWSEDQQLIYITGFTEGFVRFSLPKDNRDPRIALGHCISAIGTNVLLNDFKKWLETRKVANDLPVQTYYFDFLLVACPEVKVF